MALARIEGLGSGSILPFLLCPSLLSPPLPSPLPLCGYGRGSQSLIPSTEAVVGSWWLLEEEENQFYIEIFEIICSLLK